MSPDPPDYGWYQDAACKGMPVDMFFGIDLDEASEKRHSQRMRLERVRRVCRRCPVSVQCLEHSLTLPEPYGVWAGITRKERFRLLRDVVVR